MDFNSFKKIVQTFGSASMHWETDDASIYDWEKSVAGSEIIKKERCLDKKLDLVCPPSCDLLVDRLYTAIINDNTRQQFFLFLRYSKWLSLLFVISGFCLGWYQTHQDYVNTQSYFDTIFDVYY